MKPDPFHNLHDAIAGKPTLNASYGDDRGPDNRVIEPISLVFGLCFHAPNIVQDRVKVHGI